jgi:hypothetical protein
LHRKNPKLREAVIITHIQQFGKFSENGTGKQLQEMSFAMAAHGQGLN